MFNFNFQNILNNILLGIYIIIEQEKKFSYLQKNIKCHDNVKLLTFYF